MKKFTWLVFSLFFAVCGWADNIKMVSYFPIPYASYSDLKVTDTCDVGLMNSCEFAADHLIIQSTTTASVPNLLLNTGSIVFNAGSLDLQASVSNNDINGDSLLVGNSNPGIESHLNISGGLNVGTNFLAGASSKSVVASASTIASLNLKGYDDTWLTFPKCDATDNEISWANLKINGVEGIYLTCGSGICETFYGGQSYPSTTAKTDSCTGADAINQFSCSSAPKGSVLSCTDAWRVQQPAPTNQNPTITNVTIDTPPDTCNGDVIKKYTGAITKDCDDVYADWRGSDLGLAYSSCNLTYGDIGVTQGDCAGDPYEFYQQYKELDYNSEAFCEYIVTNLNPGGCFAEFEIPDSGDGCKRPLVGGQYLYGVGCYPIFYKRTFKGPTYQYYSRSVRCCGDE